MPGESRYDTNPIRLKGKKDLVEYVAELMGRVATGESAQRIGNTAIEDGNLTVRNGDIIVSETAGNIVLRILHGTEPQVRFFPVGTNDLHRINFFAQNDDTFGETIFMMVETNPETPTSVVDGGKIILSTTSTILSFQPLASGGNEAYIWLNYPGAPEVFDFQGKWMNQFQTTTQQALYPGQASLGAGFGSYTHTYFSAFATTVVPIVTLFNSGGTVSWVLTAQSTSSFTITWSGTTAKTINWWVFRV